MKTKYIWKNSRTLLPIVSVLIKATEFFIKTSNLNIDAKLSLVMLEPMTKGHVSLASFNKKREVIFQFEPNKKDQV